MESKPRNSATIEDDISTNTVVTDTNSQSQTLTDRDTVTDHGDGNSVDSSQSQLATVLSPTGVSSPKAAKTRRKKREMSSAKALPNDGESDTTSVVYLYEQVKAEELMEGISLAAVNVDTQLTQPGRH